MRRSCVYYDYGETAPKAYGAFCRKKKEPFHEHESGVIFPLCNKCNDYKYRKRVK